MHCEGCEDKGECDLSVKKIEDNRDVDLYTGYEI